MKIPSNALIAPEKLTNYLLVYKKRNDKSEWLAQAGYSLQHWKRLELDLRHQILQLEASFMEETAYGSMYEISGSLTGPNQKTLDARTIWMVETVTGDAKFITMYPDRKGRK